MAQRHMTPSVSVVMPVHNQQRYVRAAVESVLAQTYQDFELVVVDDGSTDDTRNVLAEIADPRMRVISAGRLGFSRALALGVREARAPWVARMDSDDLCHPTRLSLQMDFLQQHTDCVFVTTAHGIITPGERFLAPRAQSGVHWLSLRDITLAQVPFCDPATVFRRDLAIEVGLYDAEFDNEKPLWYRMLGRGRGAVLNSPLYFIRCLLGSHSRSHLQQRRLANAGIRERYDPVGARLLPPVSALPDSRHEAATLARKVVDYCLLARDFRGARATAWRACVASRGERAACGLLVRALLRRRGLRLWRRDTPHPRFVAVAQPW